MRRTLIKSGVPPRRFEIVRMKFEGPLAKIRRADKILIIQDHHGCLDCFTSEGSDLIKVFQKISSQQRLTLTRIAEEAQITKLKAEQIIDRIFEKLISSFEAESYLIQERAIEVVLHGPIYGERKQSSANFKLQLVDIPRVGDWFKIPPLSGQGIWCDGTVSAVEHVIDGCKQQIVIYIDATDNERSRLENSVFEH